MQRKPKGFGFMGAPAGSEVYLDLCRSIAEARLRFKGRYGDVLDIPAEEIQLPQDKKVPLLDIAKLSIDSKLLHDFSEDFISRLEKSEVFKPEDTARFLTKGEKIELDRLAHMALNKDFGGLKSLSQQLQVGEDFLLFVGLNLGQALLELYADRLREKVDLENWLEGSCPVCGSYPSIEKLRRDDGKRILRCSFCATEWPFKRIMCPFCGNEDHDSLRYFLVEGDSPIKKDAFRVDVCDKCKKYMKTLDERKLPESEKPDLYLENLNTLYLDVLAQRDGYISPTYWMIGPSEDLFV
jgi:formate dehydrogenase accessory protein FdhE